VLLVVAPWTVWWRRNLFAEMLPWLSALMGTPTVRWSVVCLGVITLLGGLLEARALFTGPRS
jgi:hypothetical protein